MSDCDHLYAFQGVVYSHARDSLPGTGARARFYEDRYFCQKCLHVEHRNSRQHDNSYMKPLEGSMPK